VTYLTGSGDPVYDTRDPSFDGDLVENVQYGVSVQSGGGGGGGGGGGSSGSGDAAQLEFDNGKKVNNDGEFRFDVRNTGNNDVEVVKFEIGGNLVNTLEAGNNGNPEFSLSNGEATNNDPYDAGTLYPLDSNATIKDGQSRNLELVGLRGSNENLVSKGTLESLQYTTESSETNADLYIVLVTSDDGQKTFYFE
jgi:hypothetical protein